MGCRPTICVFVEHWCPNMAHSLYMIQPPLDLSNYDQMIDSEGIMNDSKDISPVLTFPEKNFLPHSASVSLGPKIYFFGGMDEYFRERRLSHQVQVFDTNDPEQGMLSVAPMNAPKQTPCVFVADGMIYALGSIIGNCESERRTFPGSKGTGVFECYDPSSDQWQVLSDPPLPYSQWAGAEFLDCATVVGRRVFIGIPSFYVIFNLDCRDWDPLPPPELAPQFPYGSLFVQDSASLYHLRGPDIWKPGTVYVHDKCYGEQLQVVKRGPLITTKEGDYDSSLLTSPCLVHGNEQVLAAGIDLDENIFLTDRRFNPWRDLFHMGGRFFCYVVTAQLVDWCDCTRHEPNSRGVWIKFFEEVSSQTDYGNKAKFRPLASFCYKVDTEFPNLSYYIRCSVHGTVPDSWTKAPLKKRQVAKRNHRSVEPKSLQIQSLAVKEHKAEQRRHELENAENMQARDYDLKKLLTVREEEISRLAAELAKKNELLKAYEATLAKKNER